MALREYGVVAGRVVDGRAEGGVDSPHFQVHLQAAGVDYRIAVNVLSQQAPPELLFAADETFGHPLLTGLAALADGFTTLPSTGGGLALDYIRGNLFDRALLRTIPATEPGPDNDLADKLDHYTSRAKADPGARVFAFGERWGPEADIPDKIFGFSPGNGVHDIHMNQGNNGRFMRDDGVYQDGGLLFFFPDPAQWVATFYAFQSQSWHTDDTTGHALDVATGPKPGGSDPDGLVRIVAALVNPVGPSPEAESVTLLNRSAAAIDLAGWSLVDANRASLPLPGATLGAGETLCVPTTAPLQLGNRGGTISVLDAAGLKVDGVAYTREQVVDEGTSVVF